MLSHYGSRTARLSIIAGGLLGILTFACPRLCAASSRVQKLSSSAPRLTAQFAVADFDGDHRPDFADVEAGQSSSQHPLYWIAFHLSGGARQSLGISAPAGGLEIAPVDVNADGYLDVVITTLWTRQPVAVLLNDGRGNFRLSSPALFPQSFIFNTPPLGIRSVQAEVFSAVLFFNGHDWNLSGPAVRSTIPSGAPPDSPWQRKTSPGSSCRRQPSRAPPSALIPA